MMFDEPKGGYLPLHAVNEYSAEAMLKYEIVDLTTGKTVVKSEALAEADSSVCVYKVEIKPEEKHFYLVRWELDGKQYSNHYMTNIKDIDYSEYLGYIGKCGYDEFEGF